MTKLFSGYVNERLDIYLSMLSDQHNSKLKKGWDKNPQKIGYEQSSMLIGIDHSLFLYSFLIDCKAT